MLLFTLYEYKVFFPQHIYSSSLLQLLCFLLTDECGSAHAKVSGPADLRVGRLVQITVAPDLFQAVQECFNAWHPSLIGVIILIV
jgi:hypothetical protein